MNRISISLLECEVIDKLWIFCKYLAYTMSFRKKKNLKSSKLCRVQRRTLSSNKNVFDNIISIIEFQMKLNENSKSIFVYLGTVIKNYLAYKQNRNDKD